MERPTTEMLTKAWSELAGAAGTVLTPSGLSAAVVALHDGRRARATTCWSSTPTYSPTRHYCERTLRRFGVETTYYDPALGADVAALFRPNTKAILLESPGSQSLEMQDVPAIAAAAHARGICVIMDNTWATPMFFPPARPRRRPLRSRPAPNIWAAIPTCCSAWSAPTKRGSSG